MSRASRPMPLTSSEVRQVRRFFPRVVLVLCALLWTLPTHVYAVGPVVGSDCVASWCASTARVDGGSIRGALTYNLYLAEGTPTAPGGPPSWARVAGVLVDPPCDGGPRLAFGVCQALSRGQYTLWVTAVEDQGGTAVESALSNAAPFCLSRSAKARWCR